MGQHKVAQTPGGQAPFTRIQGESQQILACSVSVSESVSDVCQVTARSRSRGASGATGSDWYWQWPSCAGLSWQCRVTATQCHWQHWQH